MSITDDVPSAAELVTCISEMLRTWEVSVRLVRGAARCVPFASKLPQTPCHTRERESALTDHPALFRL
jgi:hypothetical protein